MFDTLICEDNAGFRNSLRQLLSGHFPFMHITEAADCKDALHHALTQRFDLIFVDVRLPDGSGLELTRRIKAVFADAVICVLTSYDIPEYRAAALQSGARYFMVKGDVTDADIIAVVESLLTGVINEGSRP
jgi:DNA-binding NarL/FixJ family response regulator